MFGRPIKNIGDFFVTRFCLGGAITDKIKNNKLIFVNFKRSIIAVNLSKKISNSIYFNKNL